MQWMGKKDENTQTISTQEWPFFLSLTLPRTLGLEVLSTYAIHNIQCSLDYLLLFILRIVRSSKCFREMILIIQLLVLQIIFAAKTRNSGEIDYDSNRTPDFSLSSSLSLLSHWTPNNDHFHTCTQLAQIVNITRDRDYLSHSRTLFGHIFPGRDENSILPNTNKGPANLDAVLFENT